MWLKIRTLFSVKMGVLPIHGTNLVGLQTQRTMFQLLFILFYFICIIINNMNFFFLITCNLKGISQAFKHERWGIHNCTTYAPTKMWIRNHKLSSILKCHVINTCEKEQDLRNYEKQTIVFREKMRTTKQLVVMAIFNIMVNITPLKEDINLMNEGKHHKNCLQIA